MMQTVDAIARLDDARWNLDQAMLEVLHDKTHNPRLYDYIAAARKHVADLQTDAPFLPALHPGGKLD